MPRTPRFSRDRASASPDRSLAFAISRAKGGDVDALHFLYVRHADEVYKLVNRIVRDHHAAEDITQNLFAKLLRIIGKYEQRDVPFGAWISRVARNAALDHMRSRKQIPFEQVYTSDDGYEQVDLERVDCIRTALDRLPGEQREVVILRHLAGLTPPEIASVLGKTESAVHGLHHRGRAALRAALRDLDSAPVIAIV